MNSKDKLWKLYASSFAINSEWSKVSKTLDKSINIAPISFISFRLLSNFPSYLATQAVYYGFCEILLDLENLSLMYVLI